MARFTKGKDDYMTKYAMSAEGAESFRILAAYIDSSFEDARASNDLLVSQISGLGPGLGKFELDILRVVGNVTNALQEAGRSASIMRDECVGKATKIDDLIWSLGDSGSGAPTCGQKVKSLYYTTKRSGR